MGRSPRLIPPLLAPHKNSSLEDITAHDVIRKLQNDVSEAKDNLLRAKISQSVEANKHCSLTFLSP